MGRFINDVFWLNIINRHTTEIAELKKLIKKICPHKILIQKCKDSCWLTCDDCGDQFIEKSDGIHQVAPKGSIICKYKCEVKKND